MTNARAEPRSILAFLRGRLPGADEASDTAYVELPDEPEQVGQLRWAAGAWDGMATHQMGRGGKADLVEALLDDVRAVTTGQRTSRAFAGLYERAKDLSLVRVIDELLARLRDAGLPAERLYALGFRLACEPNIVDRSSWACPCWACFRWRRIGTCC